MPTVRVVALALAIAVPAIVLVPAARANPNLIASNGALACKKVFPNGVNGGTQPGGLPGYSRFAITNIRETPAGTSALEVVCNFPVVRSYPLVTPVGPSPGFDLQVVVSSSDAGAQTVTCTAESYDGDGPVTRFATTRSVSVSSAGAARLSFTAADLPAFSGFTEVSMSCRLPEHTSLGVMFLRQPAHT